MSNAPPTTPVATALKRLGGRLVLITLVPAATLWMIAAVHYSDLLPGNILPLLATVVMGVAVLAVLALAESRWLAIGIITGLFAIVLVRWLIVPASNDRDWRPEVAVLPTVTFEDENTVTIHNLRNFDYRSRNDFDPRYEDRTYHLDEILATNFLVSYWGDEAIAHTFLSFDFKDALPLALSIEIRPEKGESYRPLAGLFKQYEITYVLGDERDLIGVRAGHRGEDVYLYRGTGSPAQARALLVDILERVNELAEKPAFYGTIGANCTTSLVKHVNETLEDKIPFSGAVLFNGFSDKFVYERGNIATPLPFIQLKPACYITGIAKSLEADPDFSRKIREHVETEIAARRTNLIRE